MLNSLAAMAFQIVCQLRGWSGPLQAAQAVPGVAEATGKSAYGLLHNLGLGELSRLGRAPTPSDFASQVVPASSRS